MFLVKQSRNIHEGDQIRDFTQTIGSNIDDVCMYSTQFLYFQRKSRLTLKQDNQNVYLGLVLWCAQLFGSLEEVWEASLPWSELETKSKLNIFIAISYCDKVLIMLERQRFFTCSRMTGWLNMFPPFIQHQRSSPLTR